MTRKLIYLGAGIAGLALAAKLVAAQQAVRGHPPDSAPGRTARRGFGSDKTVATAVTIHAARDRVVAHLLEDPTLPGAMVGEPDAEMVPIDHAEDADVWSWRNTDGNLLAKLRVRPVRDGSLTMVTGIVALEGGRMGAAIDRLMGKGPWSVLRRVLTEARMKIETGEVATAARTRQAEG